MEKKLEKVIFNSLEDIKKYQWWGNAYHDMPAFKAIDNFIVNKAKSAEEAIITLDITSIDGMGIESNCTLAELKDYIKDCELIPIHFKL